MRSGAQTHNQEMLRLRSRLMKLLEASVPQGQAVASPTRWTPAADIRTDGDQVLVELEVPGIPQEAIDVEIEGNVLTITGHRASVTNPEDARVVTSERPTGQFARAFSFSFAPSEVNAKLNDGLLTVTLSR